MAEPRDIWVDGERVSDIVDHPALSGAARTIASVYDLQLEHAATCLMPDPETGEAIGLSHIIPRSREDLYRRRRCLEEISELTAGLMGRTPDYLNVTFAGFAGEGAAWRAFWQRTRRRTAGRVPKASAQGRFVAHPCDRLARGR